MNETRDLIIGIDFGKVNSQICFYDRAAKETRSLPIKVGTSQYEMPTLLCQRAERKEFCIGLEAEYFSREKDGFLLDDLYEIAGSSDSVQVEGEQKEPWELLAYFIHGMLKFVGVMNITRHTTCLAIAMEKLGPSEVFNLGKACESLGFKKEQLLLLDYEEAFYYHVMTQKGEVCNRSVGWYTFAGDQVEFRKLIPYNGPKQLYFRLGDPVVEALPEEAKERDEAFLSFAEKTLGTENYSSIQINGNGFDQKWAEKSIKFLCYQKRRVFFGNNLFARGACAAGAERFLRHDLKDCRFMGSAIVLTDVGMDMRIMGAPAFYPLIEAGKNWYESSAHCELILDNTEELIFVVSKLGENEKKKISMKLQGLPKRPNKTTRLSLDLQYISPGKCQITVEDLGFGDMFPSGKKIWKETAQW